jgi:hypothetical protein
MCVVTMWTGDVPEAGRLAAMLLDQSSQHSLYFWHFGGRCLELAVRHRDARAKMPHSLLWDPLCCPLLREILGTLNEDLLTHEATTRAENGLAGWCAPELLRVKALTFLRKQGSNAAAAEALLQRSLGIAREQGALSWELRTATSLARLRHGQRRTPEAYDLLASVYARFTEGFATIDLTGARSLLDDMTVTGRAVRRA